MSEYNKEDEGLEQRLEASSALESSDPSQENKLETVDEASHQTSPAGDRKPSALVYWSIVVVLVAVFVVAVIGVASGPKDTVERRFDEVVASIDTAPPADPVAPESR